MPLTRRLVVALAAFSLVLGVSRGALAVCTVTSACSAAPFLNPASGCCGATACIIDSTVTLSGSTCDLDFGARNLTLSGSLVVGSRTLMLEAGSLVVTGLLNAHGTSPNPGGNVILTLGAGGLSLQGGASSGIDLQGFTAGGGVLNAITSGPVTLTGGSIDASAPSAIDTGAGGGTIMIQQTAGSTPLIIGIPILANAQTEGVGGTITLQAPAALNVTNTARISTVGGLVEGAIELDAGGLLTVFGAALIQANALNGSAGDGGSVTITAGSVNMQGTIETQGGGDPTGDAGGAGGTIAIEAKTGSLVLDRGTQGLVADAAGGDDGGEVDLITDSPAGGTLTVGAPVSVQGLGGVSGRPGGGGFIDIESANSVSVTKSLNVSGIGGASGIVSVSAERDVAITNSIVGSDSVGGGSLDVGAGHDLTLTDTGSGHNVKMNATGNGLGGAITLLAGNDLTVTGFLLDASGAGTGPGYLISLDAGRKLTVARTSSLNANANAGSGAAGGTIMLTAGSPDLAGDVQVDGDVTATGHAAAGAPNPAQITLKGCQVNISSTGLVDSTGDVNARNLVIGRAGITINGKLRTTAAAMGGSNTANYPTGTTPTVSGSSSQVSPPFGACTGGCAKPICTQANVPDGCLTPCPTCGNSNVQFPEQCDPPGCPSCDIHCRLFQPAGCNDANSCTTDTCNATFGCQLEPKADGASCDDATVCNGHEACGNGVCGVSATPLDCNDGNPCTADSCNAVSGCQHAPITGPPAPGATSCTDRCAESCSGGTCTPITPPNCNDGNPATNDSCNPATGLCVHTQGASCTSPAQCNDGNPCTADTCPDGHCHNDPVANSTSCSDGDACNGAESCLNGVCQNGISVNCDDSVFCTTDTCNSTTGTCSHAPIPGCCVTVGDCPDDGNPCTTDVCTNHECTSSIDPACCTLDTDCNDQQACTTDTCVAGHCQHANLGNGTSCGNVCQPAACQSGICVPGTPLSCPGDSDICTQDFCDPASGCVHQPIVGCCHNDAECADDSACTSDVCDLGLNVCANTPIFLGCRTCSVDTDCDPAGACGLAICGPQGFCIEHAPPECTDGNCDTTDTCVVDGPGASHCAHQPGACNDGNVCNGVESCAGGFCQRGTALGCDDGNLCTDDACDPATGCKSTPKIGYPSAFCRLDTIDGAIRRAAAQDLAPSIATKLGKLIGKARAKLAAAEAAGHGKPALKALKVAAKQLKMIPRVVRAAQKKHKIAATLATTILDAASGGSQALDTLKASATP